jgi:hypothetical protein
VASKVKVLSSASRFRGLTVFELAVLLVGGLLIGGGVVLASSDADDRDRTEQAIRTAQRIRGAAENWRREHAEGCPTVSVLKHEAYLEAEADSADPWGQRFRLSCGEEDVTVTSPGQDGKPNTADDVKVPHLSS